MNKRLSAYQDVLFEPVKGFERLKAADFETKFAEDVADLDETLVARTWRLVPNVGEIIELSNGYNVHVDKTSRWSLYESQQHYEQRVLHSAWAAFVRGTWTDRVPTEPGLYFVRDRDLGKRSVRELRKENGRLLDVSGGLVPPGRVSVWRGQWWSVVVPQLPESY